MNESVIATRMGHYLLIQLNRPAKFNAFTVDMHRALIAVLGSVAENPDTRCVIPTGAGPAFCAGQDSGSRSRRRSDGVRHRRRGAVRTIRAGIFADQPDPRFGGDLVSSSARRTVARPRHDSKTWDLGGRDRPRRGAVIVDD